jgi:urease accessory protein
MGLRATSYVRAEAVQGQPWKRVSLESAERHVRRKLLPVGNGIEVLVDLEKPVALEDGDCLVLDDGRLLRVEAAAEDLLEVTGKTPVHLARLAWHVGNRHLAAQIGHGRILIRRDPVIAGMLRGLGANLREVRESFSPEHGAYHHHEHGPQSHDR